MCCRLGSPDHHAEHLGAPHHELTAHNPLHSLFRVSAGSLQQTGSIKPGGVVDQGGESLGLVKRRNLATGLNMGHIDPLSPRGSSFTSVHPSQSTHRCIFRLRLVCSD